MKEVTALLPGVLEGHRLQVARAITLVENEQPGAHQLLSKLYPHTGSARIIGVTGAPGTGKSTLVTALTQKLRERSLTVGIIAVDPTSPFTGGALLGDRFRMRALAGDAGVFIRSMATRGSLGGLSKTTNDAIIVLDAAGFDRIIIETVGVGQAEIDVVSTAHTTVVTEAPGMGDEIQAIKAGILEIADVLVVNKADRPGADKTVRALNMVLSVNSSGTNALGHHGLVHSHHSSSSQQEAAARWKVPVMKTVSTTDEGVEALCEQIEAHDNWLVNSGELVTRENLRIRRCIENIVHAELKRRIDEVMPAESSDEIIEKVRRRLSNPYAEATAILSQI